MSTPRLRTAGKMSILPGLTYNAQFTGPSYAGYAPINGVIGTESRVGSYRYIRDFVTKGFKKSGDFRKWVAHPYSSGSIEVKASLSTCTTSNVKDANGNGITRTWSGDGLGFIFGPLVAVSDSLNFGSYPDAVNVANLQKLATLGLLQRLNPVKSQTLVMAAEADKTVAMILDRAKKLAAFYAAFRKVDVKALIHLSGKPPRRLPKRVVVWDNEGNPIMRRNGKPSVLYAHKRARVVETSRLTDAARLELEYRYGWTPLVHDIVDSLKAINAELLRNDLVKRDFLRSFEQRGAQNSIVTPLHHSGSGGDFRGTQTLTHKVVVKAYAKYRFEETGGLASRLQEFGIFDVPRTLWDLVPLSFVADWFIPTGDWLAAVTPKVGLNVIESGVVTTTEKSVRRVLEGYTPSDSNPGSWPNCPILLGTNDSFVATSKERMIGLPDLLFPPIDVNLNFKRLLDAVALFRVMR